MKQFIDDVPESSVYSSNPLLLSPLDTRVYVLRLPTLKQEQYSGAIRYQLRSLYPGNPDDTAHDYWLKRRGDSVCATVFVTSKATREAYTRKNRPLIPGTALMDEAIRQEAAQKKPVKRLVLLCAGSCLEAALYEGNCIQQYASCHADQGEELAARFQGKAGPDAPIIGISREVECGAARALFATYTAPFKTNPRRYISIETLAKRIKVSRAAIFVNHAAHKTRHRVLLTALAIVNSCTLFFSFHTLAIRSVTQEIEIRRQYEQQSSWRSEARALEQEIAALTQGPEAARQKPTLYPMIAAIHEALDGAWIRSISIQDASFTLEAEGGDSVHVLRALQEATFSDVILHQARPSAIRGEQFSISGALYADQ